MPPIIEIISAPPLVLPSVTVLDHAEDASEDTGEEAVVANATDANSYVMASSEDGSTGDEARSIDSHDSESGPTPPEQILLDQPTQAMIDLAHSMLEDPDLESI